MQSLCGACFKLQETVDQEEVLFRFLFNQTLHLRWSRTPTMEPRRYTVVKATYVISIKKYIYVFEIIRA